MANSYLSANMALVIPVPGTDPGPDWANNLNASLTIIDSHNHALGSGVQINPAGININADLPLNSNNLLTARSIRLDPQGVPLALADDLGCLYESGVDLYYNDGAGNQIRITQSGSVAGATGTITGLPSGTASAAYASGSGTFVFQQATSTGANIDAASIAIRYPGSYPTPSGAYIQLQAPTSLASGYALTLPTLPVANNTFLSISTAGVIAASLTVDNSSLAISGSNVIVKDGGITTAKIASEAVTLAKMALQSVDQSNIAFRPVNIGSTNGVVMITDSSGTYTKATAGSALITNLSATIVVAGNPVMVCLQSDGSAVPNAGVISGDSATLNYIVFKRGSSTLASYRAIAGFFPSSCFSYIDSVAPGTYTYSANVTVATGGAISVSYTQLVVYEIK